MYLFTFLHWLSSTVCVQPKWLQAAPSPACHTHSGTRPCQPHQGAPTSELAKGSSFIRKTYTFLTCMPYPGPGPATMPPLATPACICGCCICGCCICGCTTAEVESEGENGKGICNITHTTDFQHMLIFFRAGLEHGG